MNGVGSIIDPKSDKYICGIMKNDILNGLGVNKLGLITQTGVFENGALVQGL